MKTKIFILCLGIGLMITLSCVQDQIMLTGLNELQTRFIVFVIYLVGFFSAFFSILKIVSDIPLNFEKEET